MADIDELILPYDLFGPLEKDYSENMFSGFNESLMDLVTNQKERGYFYNEQTIEIDDNCPDKLYIPRSADLLVGYEITFDINIGQSRLMIPLYDHQHHIVDCPFFKVSERTYTAPFHIEPFPFIPSGFVCLTLGIKECAEKYGATKVSIKPMYCIFHPDLRERFVLINHPKMLWNGETIISGQLSSRLPQYKTPFSKILKKTDEKGEKYYKRMLKMRGIKINLQLLVVCQHFDQLLKLSKNLPLLKGVLRFTLRYEPDFIKEI